MLNSAVRYEHIKMGLTPERLLAIVSVIGSICILGWLLWYCHYGFDFTDEGFYLNWISHPFNYSASLSQFGFLYHPLYQLVGGDIAALRQANVMLNFCLGWSAGWALLSRIFGVRTLSVLPKFAISAGMASSGLLSLVFAGMWLPTPSYNSLAFQGLLITAAGLFLVDKTSSRASMVGCVLIGVGGWLVFMGKPTSAAASKVLLKRTVADIRRRACTDLCSLSVARRKATGHAADNCNVHRHRSCDSICTHDGRIRNWVW